MIWVGYFYHLTGHPDFQFLLLKRKIAAPRQSDKKSTMHLKVTALSPYRELLTRTFAKFAHPG